MRSIFINKLTELARIDDRIYLITGDVGYPLFEEFKELFPSRYLNAGISEAAMIGVSAGLAMNGKQVFVYSIAPFVTMRCFEQVRTDLCYQNLPVKLVGIGTGLTYGTAGMTHQSIEDIGIMNCLPNMTIICPGDPLEAELAVEATLGLKGPSYLRIGYRGEPVVHKERPSFEIGKGIVLRKGDDVAIISTGNTLDTAARVSDNLAAESVDNTLISMHTVKPIDRELIAAISLRCPLLVTVEEHSVIGGIGSRVADAITEEGIRVDLIKIAIPDKYPDVAGDQNYLRHYFGLSAEQISEKILSKLRVYPRS